MRIDPILHASTAVQIHLVVALAALVFGTLMWFRPKGTHIHKYTGRIFMILMLLTAFSAIFIRQINHGQFSWIHIFVPLTVYTAVQSIRMIRKGNLKKHKNAVKGLFFGALIIPGIFTLLPGRTLHVVFFGG